MLHGAGFARNPRLQAAGGRLRLRAAGFRPKCQRVGRDPAKLKIFPKADDLVAAIYHATARFPSEERVGLQALQIRPSASGQALLTKVPEACSLEPAAEA
jgi:hypothetical protein